MSDYFAGALHQSKEVTFIGFAAVCITSPAVGLILGGVLVSYLGGYESKSSFAASLAVCWTGCVIGLPFPFIDNFGVAISIVWMSIMMGSIVQSAFTGILMTLVEP